MGMEVLTWKRMEILAWKQYDHCKILMYVFIWNKTSTLFCLEINYIVHFILDKHVWKLTHERSSVFLQQKKTVKSNRMFFLDFLCNVQKNFPVQKEVPGS